MKLKPLLIGAAVVIVAVGGYLTFTNQGGEMGEESETPTSTASNIERGEGASPEQISQAFEGSGEIRCEYSDENGSGEALIKDGKVRINAQTTAGGVGYAIYKDAKVYIWQDSISQGFVFSTASLEQNPELRSRAELEAQFQQKNSNCERANVADSNFELPTGIDFQDISSLVN